MPVVDQSKLATTMTAVFEGQLWSLLVDLRTPNAGQIELRETNTKDATAPEAHCLARLWDGGNTTTLYEQIAIEDHIPPETLSTQLMGQMLTQLVDHWPPQETIAELSAKLTTWIRDVRADATPWQPAQAP